MDYYKILGLSRGASADEIKKEIVKKSKEALNEMMTKPLIEYTQKNGVKVEVGKWFREYAGYICCNRETKKVSSTGPYSGTWRIENSEPEQLTEEPWKYSSIATTQNIIEDEKTECPKPTDAVAFYHTHPASPNFSLGDFGFATDKKIAITLFAPKMDTIKVGMPGIGTGAIPLLP